MKKSLLGLLALMVLAASGQAAPEVRSLVLLGDSTVADLGTNRPVRGWGQMLGKYLPGVEIHNYALSGASSKSFLTTPSWQKAQQTTADVWLIQFGHNDDTSKGDRATDPNGDFKENLRQMVQMARDTLATPVLVTMPYRRVFLPDGSLQPKQAPYVEATKAVAKELNVPVIDLYGYTGSLFLKLGDEGSTYFTVPGDRTHFTEAGASEIAAYVAQQLPGVLATTPQTARAPNQP